MVQGCHVSYVCSALVEQFCLVFPPGTWFTGRGDFHHKLGLFVQGRGRFYQTRAGFCILLVCKPGRASGTAFGQNFMVFAEGRRR